jgi:cell division protein FtsB
MELREWENLTKRISSDYLDLDLLDEQARKILRVARSDEAIFFY